MIEFATPIVISAATSLRVVGLSVNLDANPPEARVMFELAGVGAVETIWRNGESLGLRREPAPKVVTNAIKQIAVDTPTAYSDLVAAGLNAEAIEAAAIASGIISASLTGAVKPAVKS